MDIRRTSARNREIFSEFKAGRSRESLAEQYGLTVRRICVVLIEENNRRMVSPEPVYRAMRALRC